MRIAVVYHLYLDTPNVKIIRKLYDKQVDGSGLALFRIAYSAVLLCEVLQLFYFRHLIFDKVPFTDPGEIDVTYGLIAWMITLVFLCVGLFTLQAAILNYVLSLVYIAAINNYEYHMFYVYMGVNFLLIFVNTYQVNSLDRLREKLKYSSTNFHFNPSKTVSVLNYYIILLVSCGFVYFDSVCWKLFSDNWMSGIGMWLPASLTFITYNDVSIFLNIKWLALGLGYLTFVFEAVFIFLFFRKRWRIPLFLIGAGLHLGIAIIFPIPWFGLGVTAIYLLLVPLFFWRKIHNTLSFHEPRLTFLYNEVSVSHTRRIVFLKHFDFLKAISFKGIHEHRDSFIQLSADEKEKMSTAPVTISLRGKVKTGLNAYIETFKRIPILAIPGWLMSLPGVYHVIKFIYHRITTKHQLSAVNGKTVKVSSPEIANSAEAGILQTDYYKDVKLFFLSAGIFLLLLLQINATYNTPLVTLILDKVGWTNTTLDQKIRLLSGKVRSQSKTFLGITNHPVFIDSHFAGYNHIIGVEAVNNDGTRVWLPIVTREGGPDIYNYGFCFVKWSYRVNSAIVNQDILVQGLRDFTTFWAFKNQKNINDVKFNVYFKKVIVPTAWERDLLTRQKNAPWQKAGEAHWRNGVFVANICNIESQ